MAGRGSLPQKLPVAELGRVMRDGTPKLGRRARQMRLDQAGRRRRCCMRESAYWDGETGCVVAAMGSIAGGREGSMMGGKDVDGDGMSYK